MHGGTCRGDAQLNLPVTPSLWGREACQPSRLGPGAAAWQGSDAGSACQPHVLLHALHPACSRSSTSDTSCSRAWPPLPKQKSRAGKAAGLAQRTELLTPLAALRRCPRDWKGGQGLGGGWGPFWDITQGALKSHGSHLCAHCSGGAAGLQYRY